MKTIKNKKGFTLIEILAVLIIISVIAAIIVPKFLNVEKSSNHVVEKYHKTVEKRINVVNDLNNRIKGEK